MKFNKEEMLTVIEIFTHSQLLINSIDDLKIKTNDDTKGILSDLITLQDKLIPYVDSFYKNRSVSSSTIMLEIQRKVNYVFKKVLGL